MTQNAFFNRSVHPVFFVDGAAPVTGLVPQVPASVDPATGDVRAADGKTVRADYALAEPQVELVGRGGGPRSDDGARPLPHARRPGACARPCRRRLPGLVDRARGELHALALPRGAAHHRHCEPARPVHDSPDRDGCLGRRPVGRLRIRPGQEKTLTVPVRPEGGHCAVTLRVTPTAVPAQVLGTADTRSLGVRLDRLRVPPVGWLRDLLVPNTGTRPFLRSATCGAW